MKISEIIIPILIVIFLILLFSVGMDKAAIKHDDKLWNGGHCDICDGAWEYEQAVGHMYQTTYIYICDKCGKRIELNEVR